jgi:MFS family permease
MGLLTTYHNRSYAVAGTVAGLYALALASGAPMWGRIADRRGPRRALGSAGALQATALAGFVVALGASAPWGLFVAAMVAGTASPPSSTVAKRVFVSGDDPSHERGLLAVTGLFAEAVFVLGPLIVAAVTAVAGAASAVVAAATTAQLGVWWLRGAPAVRSLRRGDREGRAVVRHGWSPARLQVIGVTVLGAFAIGAVQVSTVAHADALGADAGVLVAAIAAGGVLASFLYGGAALPCPLSVHLGVCLGAYGALIATMGMTPGLLISVVVLTLIGTATGPADTIESLLISERTPAPSRTHSFSVLVTANWLGFAVGSAVAGAFTQHLSIGHGYLAGAAAALVAGASMFFPGQKRVRTSSAGNTPATSDRWSTLFRFEQDHAIPEGIRSVSTLDGPCDCLGGPRAGAGWSRAGGPAIAGALVRTRRF